jgi:hypothetical protein
MVSDQIVGTLPLPLMRSHRLPSHQALSGRTSLAAPLSRGARRMAGRRAAAGGRLDRAGVSKPCAAGQYRVAGARVFASDLGRHGLVRSQTWVEGGEAFAGFFSLFARLSPSEPLSYIQSAVRGFALRPFAAGLLPKHPTCSNGSGSIWCRHSRHQTINHARAAAALPSLMGGPL